MSEGLTDSATIMLVRAITADGWYLSEETIFDAADLLRAGYLCTDSDYDGIILNATPEGLEYAMSHGLVEYTGRGFSKPTPTNNSAQEG